MAIEALEARLERDAFERAATAVCEGARAEGASWLGIFWVVAGLRLAVSRGLLRLPEELNK